MSKMVKLEEVCDILDNKRKPLSSVIRQERIKNKSIDSLFPYYGATQQTGYIDDYIFDEELILLGEDGVLFYDKTKPKAYLINGKSWVNNHAHVLRVRKDKAITNYILYYLNIFNYNGYVSGSTRLKLNKSKMSIIPIPLPTLTKQKEIASILDKAQELISLRKESIKKLDELSKSIFIDMFGDPILNTLDWNVRALGSIFKVKHGFAFKSEFFREKGNFILMTPGNFFEEGGYKNRGEKQKYYIGKIDKEYILEKNNLIIAMTEQAEGLLGSPLIVPESNKFLHNQRLGLISPIEPIEINFLFNLFNQLSMRKIIHFNATGIKVRHTSPTKIEDIMIGYPPLELQNKFAKIIEKIEEQKSLYEKELEKLEENFNALLQKSFK